MGELTGRHAVVTGGGKGIGAAIVCALADAGAKLTVMGRHRDSLEQSAARCAEGRAIIVDVCDPESVRRAFEEAGPVDILVNNAGAAESAPLHRTTEDLWRRMLEVNLTGAFRCAQQALPGMRERGFGRIVNLGSTASLKGYPYVAAYCAAKHGLLGFTRALALETAREGITVNAVCPGYTQTDLLVGSVRSIVDATGRTEAEAREMLLKSNPQRRFIEPEEVAAAVAWLCTEAAASVTGQAIAIAGGEVM